MNYGVELQRLVKTPVESQRETCECIALLFWYGLQAPKILELGVHLGWSTRAFLLACQMTGGHLWSVDVNPCLFARKAVELLGLEEFWTFAQADDLEFAKSWKEPVDLIFIDTSHGLVQTWKELEAYAPFAKGVILLHDTRCERNVYDAVQKFRREHAEWIYSELLPESFYGMGELRANVIKQEM